MTRRPRERQAPERALAARARLKGLTKKEFFNGRAHALIAAASAGSWTAAQFLTAIDVVRVVADQVYGAEGAL